MQSACVLLRSCCCAAGCVSLEHPASWRAGVVTASRYWLTTRWDRHCAWNHAVSYFRVICANFSKLFRSSEHVFYYPTVRFCDQCHRKKILQKSIFILIFFILGDRLFRPPYAISSLSVCLSVLSVTLVYILWPNGWMHEDELAWR